MTDKLKQERDELAAALSNMSNSLSGSEYLRVRQQERIAELERNEKSYERIVGEKSYQEVADTLECKQQEIDALHGELNKWLSTCDELAAQVEVLRDALCTALKTAQDKLEMRLLNISGMAINMEVSRNQQRPQNDE